MPFDSTYCKGCYKQIATRIWNHHVGQPGTKCNQIHRQTFLSELNKQIAEEILPNLDSKQDTDAGSNSDSLESILNEVEYININDADSSKDDDELMEVDHSASQHSEGPLGFVDVDEQESMGLGDGNGIPDEAAYPAIPEHNLFVTSYPGASRRYGKSTPRSHILPNPSLSEKRKENKFYPFKNKKDWEVLEALHRMNLSEGDLDELFNSAYFCERPLSCTSGKGLKQRMSELPSPPKWFHRQIKIRGFLTTERLILYYRNSLDCIQYLYGNPAFREYMQHSPYKLYSNPEKTNCLYGEIMSSDWAWEIQSKLEPGATLIGAVLASDKLNLAIGTPDCSVHPVLISIANIHSSIRVQPSQRAYMLLALLPIPNFVQSVNTNLLSLLEARIIHRCLDIILGPLKRAACKGVLLQDPQGLWRKGFTPLASYQVDVKEATLLAGVSDNTSHITMAFKETLALRGLQPLRHGYTTVTAVCRLAERVHPWNDITHFQKECKNQRLLGVHEVFYEDYVHSLPPFFFTPDVLHHFLIKFYHHELPWAKSALGSGELDFRYSLLQPIVGKQSFPNGVCKHRKGKGGQTPLRTLTGKSHRNLERLVMPVLDGLPRQFQQSIKALTTFHYLAQMDIIPAGVIDQLNGALDEFHQNRKVMHDKGYRTADGWAIPKFELMNTVPWSITQLGSPRHCSTETSETFHKEIKKPYKIGNKKESAEQTCRYFDQREKRQLFAEMQADDMDEYRDEEEEDVDANANANDNENLQPTTGQLALESILGLPRKRTDRGSWPFTDYFVKSQSNPPPRHTFSTRTTAFHLIRRFRIMTVDEASAQYNLPDLRAACGDFFSKQKDTKYPWANIRKPGYAIGGPRIAESDTPLPFVKMRVWTHVRVQTRSAQYHHITNKSVVLMAAPPQEETSGPWTYGRYDTCAIVNDPVEPQTPHIDMSKHHIAQLCIIFQPIPILTSDAAPHVAYMQHFDIMPQAPPGNNTTRGIYPVESHGMYRLKRACRPNGSRLGDIVLLQQIRTDVEVAPRFYERADVRMTPFNALELASEFHLNHYCNKEVFYMFHDIPWDGRAQRQ